eukprot:12409175-Karenia_brevis.AAC.1
MQRIIDAVGRLQDKLCKGVYGRGRRPINGDLTKLPLAVGLDSTEKQIVANITGVTATLSGCQETRRQMGHVFASAPLMYGHGLFLTISPSERHSGLTLRLSRHRKDDPLLSRGHATEDVERRRLASQSWPSLFSDIEIDLPGFDMRLEAVSRDPLAAVMAFRVAVTLILAGLLGIRMCHQCGFAAPEQPPWLYGRRPSCSCTNTFGSNADPMGGVFGLCAALLGA